MNGITAVSLHVNRSGGVLLRRDWFTCQGKCGIEATAIVVQESGSPWYAPSYHCTNCGDSWSEGYLSERPFRPRWRHEAIARAVAQWDAACECPVERDWTNDGYTVACKHQARP